jgi:hypothetical protein
MQTLHTGDTYNDEVIRPEVLKMWGLPLGGAVGPLGGSANCFKRDIFILNEIWKKDKMYIVVDTLPA